MSKCEKDVGNYQSPGVKGETTVSCSGDCWCRKPPPVFNDVLGVDKDGVLFCPFKHSAFSIQNVNIGTLERVTFAL